MDKNERVWNNTERVLMWERQNARRPHNSDLQGHGCLLKVQDKVSSKMGIYPSRHMSMCEGTKSMLQN